ncbi:unnamed protein product [Spirodela intermedia]|uniref:Uncharacterized protein n=1 Tax=Spirodela intermedia TaxID=51605 RepID=A0ABN7EBQ1_SPIIN|nr:unnamed protein product [Spirodela intermedia]
MAHHHQLHCRISHEIAMITTATTNAASLIASSTSMSSRGLVNIAVQHHRSSRQSHFSRVYDHSLPHSRLATGDVEGEWRTRAPISPS